MKATLRCRYAWLPQIKLKLKKMPIGTMARRYTRPVMGTFFLESRMVVKRARNCVMTVAKTRCHVVRKIGKSVELLGEEMRACLAAARTEFGCVEDILVEDNGAGAEGDPGPARSQRVWHMSRWTGRAYAMYTAG
jgi:hypothetical protein